MAAAIAAVFAHGAFFAPWGDGGRLSQRGQANPAVGVMPKRITTRAVVRQEVDPAPNRHEHCSGIHHRSFWQPRIRIVPRQAQQGAATTAMTCSVLVKCYATVIADKSRATPSAHPILSRSCGSGWKYGAGEAGGGQRRRACVSAAQTSQSSRPPTTERQLLCCKPFGAPCRSRER